jgi:hypothetical protein
MVYLKIIFWNLSGRTEKEKWKTSGQLSQLRATLELGFIWATLVMHMEWMIM